MLATGEADNCPPEAGTARTVVKHLLPHPREPQSQLALPVDIRLLDVQGTALDNWPMRIAPISAVAIDLSPSHRQRQGCYTAELH